MLYINEIAPDITQFSIELITSRTPLPQGEITSHATVVVTEIKKK